MIETERLILRPWRGADREPFARITADPRVMEFFPAVLTREESDALVDRCEAHYGEHGFTYFAAELRATGELIGFIGLARAPFHLAPLVEIGWRLAFDHWNRGLATEGAQAVLRYGFERLNLQEIVAYAVAGNVRSRRVMEKLGMTRDPADDFDHPKIPDGSPLRRQVLYRIDAGNAIQTAAMIGKHMKGIILAGGTGSRLFPLTKITNKHLLPIYDKPMIYYPIQALVDAGINDIMIVTGGRHSGGFLELLANGKHFGLKHINYTYQEGEGGIADALALAEHFADGQKICVILGDNLIEGSVREAADRFRSQPHGAHILLKEVHDAERFGVAELAGDRIAGIEEKPAKPKSNYAVTGIYMYDATVFEKIKTLVPSKRGELEITDVNNAYIREGNMTFSFLDGWWTDAGTFESLLRAANLVAQSKAKQQLSSHAEVTNLEGALRV